MKYLNKTFSLAMPNVSKETWDMAFYCKAGGGGTQGGGPMKHDDNLVPLNPSPEDLDVVEHEREIKEATVA